MFNIWRVDYDDVISSELSLILGLFQLFALNVGQHKMLMPKHRKTFKKCVAAVRNERYYSSNYKGQLQFARY